MSIFMIIGKFGCKTFATAEYFAKHLTLQIPSVRMKSQSFPENDFEEVLSKMRSVLHCEHTGSPLIWRDLQEIGTSPSYIGGISEFFDFCKEYYDVIMPVNPFQAFCINEEYKKNYWRESIKQAKEHTAKKIKRICIVGAGNPVASLLSLEIISDKFMYNKDGLELRLHDYRESEINRLESLKWDLEAVECPDFCKRTILVIDDLYDAVKGCNLLIIMCEAEREQDERLDSWLTRNHDLMKELGERIDEVDVIAINVVVTGIKLLCFNTSVLLKYCKILTQDRTIAVTHHLGLEALQYIANVTKVSPNDVFGSPVWGYVGINQLVDICHTKCLYRIWDINKRPRKNPLKKYKRAVIKFTDPPPTIIEKRDTCFRTHTCELMWQWVYSQKAVVRKVYQCDPYMSQVNATMHIIRMWMNETGCSNEIISVGIMSDGSYGIPKGIVYSFPVILQENKWKICNQLPVPHYSISLKNLIPTVLVINDKFNLAEDLPNFEDYYVPSKTEKNVHDCVTNMIQEQKELRKKREWLLNNAKFLPYGDEIELGDHKKNKLSISAKANNKLKIIEELKKERTRMKEINQSNKYSWLNKWLQKMKLQQEDGKVGLSKEDIPPGSEKGIEGKERRKSTENEVGQLEDEENLKKLFEVTPEEVTAELEQFDIIKVLGEFYGNKIIKKYEKPVQPRDEEEKDISQYVPCTCPKEPRCIEKPKIKKKSTKKISI